MKSPYVADLQPNQVVTATFLVQSKDVRQKKTGEPYLSLMLADRTGEIDAKMWDNAEEVLETFERDDFVRVRGLVQIHQNRHQLTIQKLQKADERTLEPADYFPATTRNVAEMFQELRDMVQGFQNPYLKQLGEAFLNDPEIARLFQMAPAAKTMHHAYLGGLLEHVSSMYQVARAIGPHYKVDLDLLFTGVLLHDIGKIYELTYERSFGYSTDGHMLGHMFIGLRMVDEKVRLIEGFPQKLRTLIDHMILSHHGQLEYGSPKLPLFAEALLLHHIDNLDSKMEAMRASLEKDRMIEGYFTGFNPALERQVLKKEKYLQGNPTPAPVPPVAKTPNGSSSPVTTPASVTAPPPAPKPFHKPAPSVSPFAAKLQGALVTKDPNRKD